MFRVNISSATTGRNFM